MIKKAIISLVICVIFVSLFAFGHSTPERAIKFSLFCDGEFQVLGSEVYKDEGAAVDAYECYSCQGVGASFISVKKGRFGLWYMDWGNSWLPDIGEGMGMLLEKDLSKDIEEVL